MEVPGNKVLPVVSKVVSQEGILSDLTHDPVVRSPPRDDRQFDCCPTSCRHRRESVQCRFHAQILSVGSEEARSQDSGNSAHCLTVTQQNDASGYLKVSHVSGLAVLLPGAMGRLWIPVAPLLGHAEWEEA